MKATWTILFSTVLLVLGRQALPAADYVTYTETTSVHVLNDLEGQVVSHNGVDDSTPESVSVSLAVPGPIATLDGNAHAFTRSRGPRAGARADITTMRTETSGGRYSGAAYGDTNIYYFYDFTNKGLTIDRILKMPLKIIAKGEASVYQRDLGEAGATAGTELTRIADDGHESVIESQWIYSWVVPRADCNILHSACGSPQEDQRSINLEITSYLLLEPGKPLPKLQVYVGAGVDAKSGTALRYISLSPPEVEYWGGFSTAYAWMDPVIFIDPTWEYAEWFDMTVSPGVIPAVDQVPRSMPWLNLLLDD